jgi:SLA1 homology domain 1, SHD1
MKKVTFSIAALLVFSIAAEARIWTDSTGKYSIEANLIAFNNRMVVLQREDHQLGQVPIEKLSKADQEYLKSKEASEAVKQVGGMQTWTLRNGLKMIGRVVGYARKEMAVQRRRGNIYVNDRMFDNLPEVYQQMIPKIVAKMENLKRDDKQALEDWLVLQKGQPKMFTVDGAIVELESGDEYVVPFSFFSQGDLQFLQAGWEQWLAAHNKQQYEQQDEQAFLVQSLMAARQADEKIQQQIAQMQINQAVMLGTTQLWEVSLYPGRGVAGRPQWVVMPGINSREAQNAALAQYPGYVVGPVRKVAGY